jgi:hypothetical protein
MRSGVRGFGAGVGAAILAEHFELVRPGVHAPQLPSFVHVCGEHITTKIIFSVRLS